MPDPLFRRVLVVLNVFLPAIAVPLAGCADVRMAGFKGPIQLWAVPDHAQVFPDSARETENEVFSDADGTVRIEAAVNETVAFQLVVQASGDRGSIDRLRSSGFSREGASIPPDAIRLYRAADVEISRFPSWYLRLSPYLNEARRFSDVLIPIDAPRGALPARLEPGQNLVFWAEVHIPVGTSAGAYTGKLEVFTAGGGVQALNVALRVLPFALPQTRHLRVAAGLNTQQLLAQHLRWNNEPYAPKRISIDDPLYDRSVGVIDATIELLHRHRCSAMLTDVHPVRRIGLRGDLELDWADYDRLVASVLDGTAFEDRIPAAIWPLPVDSRNPSPEAHGGWGSQQYENLLTDYVRQCVDHFDRKEWIDRHFVWLPMPGQTRAQQYEQFNRLATLMTAGDPRVRTICPLTPNSMAPFGWLNDPFQDVSAHTAIWCPPGSLADHDALAAQRDAGKETWLRPDRPPFVGSLEVIAPPVDARSLAWMAYRWGHRGILLPLINADIDVNVLSSKETDQALIWPGQPYGLEQPVPSVRLKRLLRGLQDFEYLWLLEQNGRPAIAASIAEDMAPYGGTASYGEHFLDGRPGGWVSDPSAWAMARRLMADELVSALRAIEGEPPFTDDVSRFEQQIEWARLIKVVREVRVQVEGVSVRIDSSDMETPVRVAVHTTVFNATRKPISGTLKLFEPPAGWIRAEPSAQVTDLGPARAIRQAVEFKTPPVLAGEDGAIPVAVALHDDNGQVVGTGKGRICVLTSQALRRPVTIDGRLDDWPLAEQNVAADFVLVGAADTPKRSRREGNRPTEATRAFVCHDDDFLYIAFNCDDQAMDRRVIRRSNVVSYDELWPTDEDLVEVLLDPTGRALDAGQMIHLIVKANGAVVAERGAECVSRVAEHERWLGEVIAAIDDQTQADRWTVEMRIPLEAFGRPAEVWGINFGRYHARLGEYASWTAARRFLYTPVTLGNLRVPAK